MDVNYRGVIALCMKTNFSMCEKKMLHYAVNDCLIAATRISVSPLPKII